MPAERFTVNTAPPDMTKLPGYAFTAFLETANSVVDYVSRDEAVQIGRRAAQSAIERENAVLLRRDRGFVGRVERHDRVRIRLDQSSVVHHENGWMDVWGVATRVGVLDYADPAIEGGVFRELRPFAEVMDPVSLATLFGVPFTITHPDDDVTSANTRDLAHGVVLEVKAEGDLVWVRIRVWSDEAKEAIAGGMIELSCGYSTVLDETPGTTADGQPYHGIQRQIVYDHIALVDLARAGAIARLRLDGYRCLRVALTLGAPPMKKIKIRIDSKDYELPAFMLPHLQADHVATLKKRDGPEGKRADFAVGQVTITPEEGAEPVTLVLPMATVEQIMSMLGAAPPASEPPAAPAAVEEEDEADAGEEQEGASGPPEPAAGTPPATPPAGAQQPRADANAAAKPLTVKQVEEIVSKRIDAGIAAERKRSTADSRRRADTCRRADRVLDSGFAWERHDTEGVQLAAITKVFPERNIEAQKLAGVARKDSAEGAEARGALGMLFSVACDAAKKARQDDADEASHALDEFNEDKGGEPESREDAADDDLDLDPVAEARRRQDSRMKTGTPKKKDEDEDE